MPKKHASSGKPRTEKNKKKTADRRSGIWELDYFPTPISVAHKKSGKLYYPPLVLIVHQESYFIINACVIPEMSIDELKNTFLKAMAKTPLAIPQEIQVKKQELVSIFQDIAQELDVKIILVKRFKVMPSIKRDMSNHFKRSFDMKE